MDTSGNIKTLVILFFFSGTVVAANETTPQISPCSSCEKTYNAEAEQCRKLWIPKPIENEAFNKCLQEATRKYKSCTNSCTDFNKTDQGHERPVTRNVLIFIADDLGAERILSVSMPNLDKLMDAGITFENAWSNPTCSPTRAGIMTGQHAFRHEVSYALSPSDDGLDTRTADSLPETLPASVKSGLFGKWHLGKNRTAATSIHGFDYFAGTMEGHLESYSSYDKVTAEQGSPISLESGYNKYATSNVVDDAYTWIEQQIKSDLPWLAIVSFNAPHATDSGSSVPEDKWEWLKEDLTSECWSSLIPPWFIPHPTLSPSTTTIETTIYNAHIHCLDTQMGRLLDDLQNSFQDELEKTTVIFIGDNGTPGQVAELPLYYAPSKDINTAKGTVYEGGIKVPFIVADGYRWVNKTSNSIFKGGTGTVVAKEDNDALVHTIDIFATTQEILHGSGGGKDSISLIPYLHNTSHTEPRKYNYTQVINRDTGENKDDIYLYAIRDERYKMIVKATNHDLEDEENRNLSDPAVEIEIYDVSKSGSWENPVAVLDPPEGTLRNSIKTNLGDRMIDLWKN